MSLFLNMEQMEHVSNVRKICENTDFHWPVFSRMGTESSILFLTF